MIRVNTHEAKTKLAHQILKRMGMENEKCLLILDGHNPTILRATRNLPNLYVTTWQSLNAYDVLNCQRILFTKDALEKLVEANKA